MACFLVPAAEAVVTTIISKRIESQSPNGNAGTFAGKIKWLNKLLWGGSALLAFEHLWHGEIVPWFPFLTATGSPEAMSEVLHEMATVGVTMAVLVTAFWGALVFVTSRMEKEVRQLSPADNGGA